MKDNIFINSLKINNEVKPRISKQFQTIKENIDKNGMEKDAENLKKDLEKIFQLDN